MFFKDAKNIVKNVHMVNEIPTQDFDKIMDTIFDPEKANKLDNLGSGAFGTVYCVIGESGFEYAVKVASGFDTEEEFHDAHYLEDLQGSDCYLKLLFYVDGTVDKPNIWDAEKKLISKNYLVMVTPKVNGYTLSSIREEHNNIKKRAEFVYNMSNNILDKLKEALQYAINTGICPKDLHQGNIMFDIETGRVIIVDTGNFRFISNNDKVIKSTEDIPHTRNCIRDMEDLMMNIKKYVAKSSMEVMIA